MRSSPVRASPAKLHTTDHEKALVEAYEQGLQAGRAQEREWRQRAETVQVVHLEHQIRTLREELDAKNRRFEVDGHQAVTGYGYRWNGSGTLEVDDRAPCP
ncbi:hypothetical protein ACIQRK_37455 [Streptomyces anulatus]